jgi:4-amino-4-deoxy-L-arabinose transferase-like glycosyltransferase
MLMHNLKFRIQNLLLPLILILAAFMRLYRIQDYMTFLGDEGRDVLVVYNILHGHLTLLGPTSSVGGFFLGPIYYYFMAPFLWLFNYNPVGPAIGVALVGIATVWLIYWVGKDFFSTKVGLIAAFIYAISPLVINYSRSSWNPNPLPFVSLLILYLIYKAVTKNSLKLFFVSGILFGIAMQLHYLAIFLGVVMAIYLAIGIFYQNGKITTLLILFKDYFSIFVGFLIGWSPFLAFEIRHGFMDFKNIFNFVLFSGKTGAGDNFFVTIYDVFFRIFGRLVFYFPSPDLYHRYNNFTLLIWQIFVILFAISATGLIIFSLYKAYKLKSKDFEKYLLLVVWLIVGVLLFGFYKKDIYDYYFAFLFPLPFLLIAFTLNFIQKIKYLKTGIFLSTAFLIIIAVLNFSGIPFQYEPNRQLKQMQTIADFVFTKTDAKPYNFALISGGNSDYAYRYFFTTWNNPPVTIDEPAKDPKRQTVTDQLLVVCETPCEPLGNSLWEIAGFGRADIQGHWKVSVVDVYKLIHYKGK